MKHAIKLFTTTVQVFLATIFMLGCSTPPDRDSATNRTSKMPELQNSKNNNFVPFHSDWNKFEDRIWVGNNMWVNDFSSWQIKQGKLLCTPTEFKLQKLTLLSRAISPGKTPISMSVTLDHTNIDPNFGAAGFILGVRLPDLNNSETNNIGNPGIFAGITPHGKLVIKALPTYEKISQEIKSTAAAPQPLLRDTTRIMLTVMPIGDRYAIQIQHFDTVTSAEITRQTLWNVPASLVQGHAGLACVPHENRNPQNGKPLTKSNPLDNKVVFDKWAINGVTEVTAKDAESQFGPIVGAWHTLDNNTLKMNVQLMPVGKRRNFVKLQTFTQDKWETISQSEINSNDFSAAFVVTNWEINCDQPYRLEYGESLSDGSIQYNYWSGTIPAGDLSVSPVVTVSEPLKRKQHPSASNKNYNFLEKWGLPSPDVYIFSALPQLPSKSKQELKILKKWYRWCFANRELGRNNCCLGIYNDSMTYKNSRIEIADSAAPQEQTPAKDWESWSHAYMKLVYTPNLYHQVAARDESETPATKKNSKSISSATSGYGYIQIKPLNRSVTFNRVATVSNKTAKEGKALPGWPITCKHNMAYDRENMGYLPAVEIMGQSNAVIQVINEDSGKLVYSIRSASTAFLPRIFRGGHYSMNIGEPETHTKRTFTNLIPQAPGEVPTIRVNL